MEFNFNCIKANYDNVMNYVGYYPHLRAYYASWLEQAEEIMKSFAEQLDKPNLASFSVKSFEKLENKCQFFYFFHQF